MERAYTVEPSIVYTRDGQELIDIDNPVVISNRVKQNIVNEHNSDPTAHLSYYEDEETGETSETFVEATGLGEPSSRIEVEMEDKPGALAKVAQLIKKHNVNIVSVMTIPAVKKGKRIVVFRLSATDPSAVRKEIEGAGYPVVSVAN